MRSLINQAQAPLGRPLLADDILEFHAGRLVLLISVCGGSSTTISGLTKMAKLDFFVRYPDFFSALNPHNRFVKESPTEAAMVRHHYGPWDKRYYHVLAYLEARELVRITRPAKTFKISLTRVGKQTARAIAAEPAFAALKVHMENVSAAYSHMTGTELKNLIYASFAQDVARQRLGNTITRSKQ